jgi:rod shape-determining protein MreC
MPKRSGVTPPSTRFRRTDADGGLRTCIVLVVVSLVIFTLSVREGTSGGFFTSARGTWMTITTPIRWVGGACTAPF